MVPEKLRALYVTGVTQAILRAQIWFADKIVCVTASQRFQTPRHFLGVFPAVEREMRK
jgi:hypothetical protein